MSFLKKIDQNILSYGYLWTAIFILSALEGIVAVVAVVRVPSELENRVFWGLSSSRLMLLVLIVAILLFFIYLTWLSLKPAWHLFWNVQLNADTRLGKFLFIILPFVAIFNLLIPAAFLGLHQSDNGVPPRRNEIFGRSGFRHVNSERNHRYHLSG